MIEIRELEALADRSAGTHLALVPRLREASGSGEVDVFLADLVAAPLGDARL